MKRTIVLSIDDIHNLLKGDQIHIDRAITEYCGTKVEVQTTRVACGDLTDVEEIILEKQDVNKYHICKLSKRPRVKPCPICGKKRGSVEILNWDTTPFRYYRVCQCGFGFPGLADDCKTKAVYYWNLGVDYYYKSSGKDNDIYGKRL